MAGDSITSPAPSPVPQGPVPQGGELGAKNAPPQTQGKNSPSKSAGKQGTPPALAPPSLVTVDSPDSTPSKVPPHKISMPYAGAPRLAQPPMIDAQSISIILNSLRGILTDKEATSQKKEIKAANSHMQALHQKTIKSIHKSIEDNQSSDASNVAGKVFGWIGAIIGLIVAVVATIATEGNAWPLLAVAIMGVGMMILSETGAMDSIVKGVSKLFYDALRSFGVSADKAREASQYLAVISIVITVVAANITAMVASGGTSGMSQAAVTIFQVTRLLGSLGEMTTMVGQGAAHIASSVYRSRADNERAQQMTLRSEIKFTEAQRSQIVRDMRRTSKLIQNVDETVHTMMKDIAQGQEFTIRHMV